MNKNKRYFKDIAEGEVFKHCNCLYMKIVSLNYEAVNLDSGAIVQFGKNEKVKVISCSFVEI